MGVALGYVHDRCDKFALIIESVKTVSTRGGFDVFHSLVGLVGASWSHNLCEVSQRSHHRDCESCPARILSLQLLDIVAGAIGNKNNDFQLRQDQASHPSHGVSSGCERFWNFLLAWKTLMGDFKKLLPEHRSHCYRNVDDGACSRCPVRRALPVVRALQKAAVNELTDKALMACGGRLPVELSDMVVEASILAEGLPLGPSIWEIVERPKACK